MVWWLQDNAVLRDQGVADTAADMFYVNPAIFRAKMVTKLVKVRSIFTLLIHATTCTIPSHLPSCRRWLF